jgi:predicted enzyme related to lactoylglutathione lyase
MKVSFTSVLIGVSSIIKSKTFYEEILDITFDEVRPPFSNFYLNGIEFMVEENTPERSTDWDKKYIGREMGICLEVLDIDLFLAQVVILGGEIIESPHDKPWGTREAKFADLDRNIFIIEQVLK